MSTPGRSTLEVIDALSDNESAKDLMSEPILVKMAQVFRKTRPSAGIYASWRERPVGRW